MKKALLFLVLSFSHVCMAQQSAVYRFERDLHEMNGKFPAFSMLGKRGVFVEEHLPGLRNMRKVGYHFFRCSGLSFDNAFAGNLLSGSYTIEMYFRLDRLDNYVRVLDFKNGKSDAGAYIYNGRVNFYKLVISDRMIAEEGEYIHWVLSRDAATKVVTVYANGEEQLKLEDYGELAVIDADNKLNFFYDDLVEPGQCSGGVVAFIKLFDHVLSPEEVGKNFDELGHNMQYRPPVVTDPAINDTLEIPDGFALPDSLASSVPALDSTEVMPAKEGKTFVLKSLSFETGRYTILPESFPELDTLVKLMVENPEIEIFLSGHTDHPGDAPENMELSDKRVLAVEEYLVKKGIEEERISGKGFGGTQPVADFNLPGSGKLNRRVEFTILKKEQTK